MDVNQLSFGALHFGHPWWLWVGLVIPLIWAAYFLFHRTGSTHHQLEKFVDKHLLPYLLVNSAHKRSTLWKRLLVWSAVWACLTIALAGPRWNYREVETFSRDQTLVIVLDLSESMNATDVAPSRLVRAKQKIEDLINMSEDVKIGLVAFAADPHMITPITEDKETIRHLLPSLDTDLVYVQGSRLSTALDMAATLLKAEPGNNQAILVISDGGFEDASAISTAKKMAAKGIVIHAMGVGTVEGAPLKDKKGNVINKNGAPILSRLEKEKLREISIAGNGRYLEAHYSDHDEAVILSELEKGAEAQMKVGKKMAFWDEHFYLLVLPVLPIILWWFRRGHVVAMALIFTLPANAAEFSDYFMNTEERGKQSVESGDYETAAATFQDPYRKGVAHYKAGQFAQAEQMFRHSTRPEVDSSAGYNLGNALVQQQKLQEAVTAYEEVLKKYPDHTKARENLELVKKMLEQQKQEDKKQDDPDQQKSPEDQNKKGSKGKPEDKNQDSPDSDEKGQQQDSEDSDGNEPKPEEKPQQNDGDAEEDKQDQNDQQKPPQQNDGEGQQEPQGGQGVESPPKQGQGARAPKSQQDQDADLWLNRLANDPKEFMKNKFHIESNANGTKEGVDPW